MIFRGYVPGVGHMEQGRLVRTCKFNSIYIFICVYIHIHICLLLWPVFASSLAGFVLGVVFQEFPWHTYKTYTRPWLSLPI